MATDLMNRRWTASIAIAVTVSMVAACNAPSVLTDLIEARRLAAEMHVEFLKATDASNRAVMSETDDASREAAEEAAARRNAVSADLQSLRRLIATLKYSPDAAILELFAARFEEYQQLDDQILPLAVENTNLKAQRLSFTEARDAVKAFRSALAADHSPAAARAEIAILEILAMEAPHIAEARDEAMTAMERDMSASARQARQALEEPGRSLPPLQRDAARQAFDRFMTVHAEILRLSRRNSDVRSLAMTLGNKQKITAQCEAELLGLEQALSEHEFRATR